MRLRNYFARKQHLKPDNVQNIVVAGASGYIGRSLLPKLLENFPKAQIIALSRSEQESDNPRIVWRPCDLFSLESLSRVMPEKVDLAFYLVHSMGPTAHLDQGNFQDYDLLLADNFARSVKAAQVGHMIYLGGLIPQTGGLSTHLQSRLEVEEVFAEFELPRTVFRAGLILGDEGSSFQILLKLVERLPFMICPSWTQTQTTPVDLETVLSALVDAARSDTHVDKTYDLAGCRPLSYIEMMRETAKAMGKKRYFLTVPFFTPTLSRLWVSLITNSPRGLVYPLVESLEHKMVARPEHMFSEESSLRSYAQLLEKATLKTKRQGAYFFRFRAASKSVRSVQRLNLKAGKDAAWIKRMYVAWLPRFLSPVVKVVVEGPVVTFALFTRRLKMLQVKLDGDLSDGGRQLLYITGGLLVSGESKGWLEFRTVRRSQFVMASIHDYRPSLPWFVYVFTQAKLHLWVMRAFGRHLDFKREADVADEPIIARPS
jgi:uncharacterized protein YbjT (DUF2867 family)